MQEINIRKSFSDTLYTRTDILSVLALKSPCPPHSVSAMCLCKPDLMGPSTLRHCWSRLNIHAKVGKQRVKQSHHQHRRKKKQHMHRHKHSELCARCSKILQRGTLSHTNTLSVSLGCERRGRWMVFSLGCSGSDEWPDNFQATHTNQSTHTHIHTPAPVKRT